MTPEIFYKLQIVCNNNPRMEFTHIVAAISSLAMNKYRTVEAKIINTPHATDAEFLLALDEAVEAGNWGVGTK